MQYKPVLKFNQLPLYIIQPANSAKRWQLKKLIDVIEQEGGIVSYRILANTSDGFDIRQDERTDDEKSYSQRLPLFATQAVKLLAGYSDEITKRPLKSIDNARLSGSTTSPAAQLRRFVPVRKAPPLNLKDIDGKQVSLASLDADFVLVNFWASWCPPCVEELSSLQRLQARFSPKKFRVISVDVGESPAEIRLFFKQLKVDLPVWLDPDGETVKDWKISAFPTSYVVDTKGNMYYGLFGAINWDRDEVADQIKLLQ